ncbi:hypothetical protein ACOME3_006425 [Neoechinorhynchus agilis]
MLRQQMIFQEEQFKLQIDTLKEEIQKVATLSFTDERNTNENGIDVQNSDTANEFHSLQLERSELRCAALQRVLHESRSRNREFSQKIIAVAEDKIKNFEQTINLLMEDRIKCFDVVVNEIKEKLNLTTCSFKNFFDRDSNRITFSEESVASVVLDDLLSKVEIYLKLDEQKERSIKYLKRISELEVTSRQKIEEIRSDCDYLRVEKTNLEQDVEKVKFESAKKAKRDRSMIKDLQNELRTLKRQTDQLVQIIKKENPELSDDVEDILATSPSAISDDLRSQSSSTTTIGDFANLETSSRLYDSFPRSSRFNDILCRSGSFTKDRIETSKLAAEREVLIEKVKHLESSNTSMASDLITKSELIHHLVSQLELRMPNVKKADLLNLSYCTKCSRQAGKRSSYRVTEDPVIRALQNALENALTENIQLKKDLDFLSNSNKDSTTKN